MWVRHIPVLGKQFIWITHHDWHSCLKSMKQVESLIERLINDHNKRQIHPNQTVKCTFLNKRSYILIVLVHTWPGTWSRWLCRETRALWIFTLVKTSSRIPCHPEMSSSWDLKSDMGVGHWAHVEPGQIQSLFFPVSQWQGQTKLGLVLKKFIEMFSHFFTVTYFVSYF